ncbi:DUF1491 family protein [Kaustia mangrovi]|uniref:DUF1491 family protein n=1 Tax=Kaustia mangrovi TaxID=2593653 RepID=A0A7S8HCT8_9HYPH|nr:DUF1491 family protein [Kaustia mangrovi]QPC43799.1 DUF1491 family protein [Kaustia mangrovi]
MSDDFSPPPRLRSSLWVQAQVRLCSTAAIPAVVSKRGDPDAGSILVKIWRGREDCLVYTPMVTMEGERGWMQALGGEPVTEAEADAYLARQASRDSDLWILEIEDPKGLYRLDGIID